MTTSREYLLEHLINNELAKLRRFFATKVPGADVNDLVQQTMLAFVERRDQIVGSERAYLMGIARYGKRAFDAARDAFAEAAKAEPVRSDAEQWLAYLDAVG